MGLGNGDLYRIKTPKLITVKFVVFDYIGKTILCPNLLHVVHTELLSKCMRCIIA